VRPRCWSRSEVGRIVSEAVWFVCPDVADVVIGSETSEGLQPLGEVVGIEEGGKMIPELPVGVVVVAPNGGLLKSPVHPLDLAVGPGVVGFGQAMFDAMFAADAVEPVQSISSGASKLRYCRIRSENPVHRLIQSHL
jgi:hypothetical protein